MQTPHGSSATDFWENRYRTADVETVSWYEPVPRLSLELIELSDAEPDDGVIDIGGGASFLAQSLSERGFHDVSVLDASHEALEVARSRWSGSDAVDWIAADLLEWEPTRTWKVWHDRAVFHFLTDPADRATYRALLTRSIEPGGQVIVATFAPDGPTMCSGLEVARYSTEELASEIGEGFTLVASGNDLHCTPSDAEQNFSWVLLERTVDQQWA